MRAMNRSGLALGLLSAFLVAGVGEVEASTRVWAARVAAEIAVPAGTIRGSGSTFADRLSQKLIVSMRATAPRVKVVYRPIGSGKGKSEFGKGLTDFAGTDSLVKPSDGPKDGEFLYVPTAAAPISVSYHLRGVSELRLSAPTLARIFQRDIIRWNDPAIQKAGRFVRSTYTDPWKADQVKAFVRYVLTDGQRLAAVVNYARLPEALRLQALAQLDKISVGG